MRPKCLSSRLILLVGLIAGVAALCIVHAQPLPSHPWWAKRITGYLTAKDGTRLRYSALLPKDEGRFPVIINYSGYDPGSIGGLAYAQGDSTMSPDLDKTLLEQGYAVVGVNARGTGCSEGEFDFASDAYGKDGKDAVEFIASQPWSDGRVGMANWSWAGISQLATAIEQPLHLKAIAPGMVVADSRLDNSAPGGVLQPIFFEGWVDFIYSRWDRVQKSATAEHDEECLKNLNGHIGYLKDHWLNTMMLQHPLRDAVSEAGIGHLALHTSKIQVPVLSFEAFQDEAVTVRGGYYQETLKPGQVWLIQSNGPHDLYESTHFRETLVAFMDHFVKGMQNGFEQRPHVEVWLESGTSAKRAGHAYDEAAAPRYSFTRPQFPVQVKVQTFALSTGGTLLDQEAGTGKADTYNYPVPGPSVDTEMFQDAWGPQQPAWRKGSLAYTSAPLASTLVAYGPASADLWLSSTATDTDLQVTLTELRPDGQEVFIQRGWLRASDRAVDPNASTAVRPVLLDKPGTTVALTPDKPVLARVEINKFSHPFRSGSRIRIWIDAPSDTGEFGFDDVSVRAKNTIWHDEAHPSKLVIGILPDIMPPSERARCGEMLKEPCRKDPLAKTS